MGSIGSARGLDLDGPVEIAERIWWVGQRLPGDSFQCHVYLIEHGDQSVLLDPGSLLTFDHTLEKIERVTSFGNIRWFVCHHQDVDITAALPRIDRMIRRPDAAVVTHWRAQTLLKHYGLTVPFWYVERNDWRLDLGGRELRFVFTPYAHFPGAFVTFDERTGTLFSSDLFGGFSEDGGLFATDESYFESMKPFHEHYMPSRDVLVHALTRIEALPLRIICPQHGSIIPGPLIRPLIARLKGLDCGLYLMAREDTDIHRLSRLNQMLRDITSAMVVCRDFRDVAGALLEITGRALPVDSLEFFTRTADGATLHLSPATRYRGVVTEAPAAVSAVLGSDRKAWTLHHPHDFALLTPEDSFGGRSGLMIPLFSPDRGVADALAILVLREPVVIDADLAEIVQQLSIPLGVALEREAIYRALDDERQRFYERSIRDPLTGLYTRFYMQDAVSYLLGIHDRDPSHAVAVAMVDIDFFKSVNDTFGHHQGDEVLCRVAGALKAASRAGDLPVRLGGEEFAVFAAGNSARNIDRFAERLRSRVEALTFAGVMASRRITVSVGTAVRRPGEPLDDFMGRADRALYRAKDGGRNRVCRAE